MSSPSEDDAPMKRIKSEDDKPVKKEESVAPKYNPYLAHTEEYKDAYGNGHPKGSPLSGFTRRETTAKQAFDAENGDNNPFTGEPHSQQYFSILKMRRNLPVHKQR